MARTPISNGSTVPGHAQPPVGAHERAQQGIAREVRVDGIGVGVEVEQPADLRDDVHEAVDVREVRPQQQRRAARVLVVRDLDHRGPVIGRPATCHPERAAIHRGIEVDMLDARDRARREELEDRVPRERGPVRQPELEAAVGDEPARIAPAGPELLRREREHLLHDAVHVPHRLEPGRGRDAGHRQVGVVEEAPREVRPA